MRESGNARLLVVRDGKLAGIVALRDIMRLIRLKEELGPRSGAASGKRL